MPPIPTLAHADLDTATAAAACVVTIHTRFREWARPGVTLGQIDAFVARQLEDLKCRSCFLHYKAGRSPAFPSHACLSVNECVVHGTAAYFGRPLREGDLFKLDIGVWHGPKGKEMIGDAAWTYSFGTPTAQVRALMECGKESLRRGVAELRPGNRYLDWARAVQGHVEGEAGFHLVRGLGGHGIGKRLHQPPYISNTLPEYPGEWPEGLMACEEGVLVAVEPMIAVGTGKVRQIGTQWPVYTADGSMSVHYEHDVLITADGPRVLTAGLDHLDDVIM